MYLGRIRSVRDISRDDRARIATCSLRTPTDRLMENYSIDNTDYIIIYFPSCVCSLIASLTSHITSFFFNLLVRFASPGKFVTETQREGGREGGRGGEGRGGERRGEERRGEERRGEERRGEERRGEERRGEERRGEERRGEEMRGKQGRGGEGRGREGRGGREGREGGREEGWREGRDDCYTFSDGTTIFIYNNQVTYYVIT